MNFQNTCNLQSVDRENNNKDDREHSSYREQVGGDRVLRIVILENNSMGNFVFFKIGEVHSYDPYVENENTNSSPQSEILIENSVCVESHVGSCKDNAYENDYG